MAWQRCPGVVDEVLEPGLVRVEVAGDEKPRGLVRHLSVGRRAGSVGRGPTSLVQLANGAHGEV
jgi:hypothetical protein